MKGREEGKKRKPLRCFLALYRTHPTPASNSLCSVSNTPAPLPARQEPAQPLAYHLIMQNFAMMGIAAGPSDKGLLTVTDDDTIEKSNLSRQFLFRDWNIGR